MWTAPARKPDLLRTYAGLHRQRRRYGRPCHFHQFQVADVGGLARQPHFIGQPDGVQVFWGYGLFVDQEGDFVRKKMSDCTGEELLVELIGHLGFEDHKDRILASANCIPCMMPFITSQFMPRVKRDRPLVRPVGTVNLAFIGQYCEIPDDVVFTVEYSVRSAQTAVYSLLGLDKQVSPLYKGQLHPSVLLASAKTLLG